MNRIYLYFRLQYKLLALLLVVIVPFSILCLRLIKLDTFSCQILLAGLLIFLKLFFDRSGPDFLQLDLKKYVQKKIKRVPSNKDLAKWQEINNESQHVMFILVGLFIFSLSLK